MEVAIKLLKHFSDNNTRPKVSKNYWAMRQLAHLKASAYINQI